MSPAYTCTGPSHRYPLAPAVLALDTPRRPREPTLRLYLSSPVPHLPANTTALLAMARPFGCRTSKPRPSTAATVPYRLVRWSTAIMGLSFRVAEDRIGRNQRCRTGRASPREQGELCPAAGTADQP